MTGKSLTKKQAQVLQAIGEAIDRCGYAPTLQELSRVFEVSKSAVFERVQGIEESGHIAKERDKARGILLTKIGRRWYANRKRNPHNALILSEQLPKHGAQV